MSVASEITRIKTNISNAYTELKNKNASLPSVENSDGLANSIASISTGGGTIEKGLVINECDSDGYPIDMSIVGMTEIPAYYCYYTFYNSSTEIGVFGKVGSNLHLPNNLTSIGLRAFMYSNALAITELPESVVTINNSAFNSCNALALSKLPTGLTKINDRAFYSCNNITLTSLPDNITTIEQYAFYACKNIKLTSLPDKVTSIGASSFQSCVSLTSMCLPTGITTLPATCFNGCEKLYDITCLGNISVINASCFGSCSVLTKLVLPNITKVPTLSNTNVFNNTPIKSGTGYIYIPDELVEEAKVKSNWSTYAAQIKGISELPTE